VTPFESYYGQKPDLSSLKVFGSRVCVKRSGDRSGKIDRHDFSGIFIGYTAMDHNICYIDLDTGTVKQSHHAIFDEAWYLQPHRPPAAQLLYDLGLEPDDVCDPVPQDQVPDAPWPPLPSDKIAPIWKVPPLSRMTPLQLRETSTPRPLTAAAALLRNASVLATKACCQSPSDTVTEYLIGKNDMAMVYMSPDPYFEAFEEVIDLHKFDLKKHHTAGLCLAQNDRQLILGSIAPSTPGAWIPRWRSRIKGAWLIKVGDTQVSTIADVICQGF
jgi:hypothetical protein